MLLLGSSAAIWGARQLARQSRRSVPYAYVGAAAGGGGRSRAGASRARGTPASPASRGVRFAWRGGRGARRKREQSESDWLWRPCLGPPRVALAVELSKRVLEDSVLVRAARRNDGVSARAPDRQQRVGDGTSRGCRRRSRMRAGQHRRERHRAPHLQISMASGGVREAQASRDQCTPEEAATAGRPERETRPRAASGRAADAARACARGCGALAKRPI